VVYDRLLVLASAKVLARLFGSERTRTGQTTEDSGTVPLPSEEADDFMVNGLQLVVDD
jgi:hypothetical protein